MNYEDITKIVLQNDSISINDDGVIVGATKVECKGGSLIIGENINCNSSMNFFNGGSFSSFSSSGNVIQSMGGPGGVVLSGPRSTVITLNGIRMTYGQIMDWHSGTAGESETPKPVIIYSLGPSCLINCIECNGGGSLENISSRWVSESLTVNVRGSGNVQLPQMKFTNLNASVAGSGKVVGNETSTQFVFINVAGSGDVNGIHVLNSGSVSVAGSGDVNITAENPRNVSQNVAGSGDINVRACGKKSKTMC